MEERSKLVILNTIFQTTVSFILEGFSCVTLQYRYARFIECSLLSSLRKVPAQCRPLKLIFCVPQ